MYDPVNKIMHEHDPAYLSINQVPHKYDPMAVYEGSSVERFFAGLFPDAEDREMFFAYAGYGVITNAAADVQHPKRTIRLGIYITILAVMALYMALAHVVLNFIPAADLEKNADTAVAVAADKLLGKWGYGLIYVAAVMAFVSGINATFFSIFRISRSLAEQGVLPKIYEKKFWKRGTYGNILTSAIVLLAAIFMDFSSIVNLSSGAYLVSYLGIFAANWHLRRETGSSKILILAGFGLMLFILTAFIVSIAVG